MIDEILWLSGTGLSRDRLPSLGYVYRHFFLNLGLILAAKALDADYKQDGQNDGTNANEQDRKQLVATRFLFGCLAAL